MTDKYLLLCNEKLDTFVDVFTFEGEYINRFLPKGEGPGEALSVTHLQYDRKNNCIYAPDTHKCALLRISGFPDNPRVETVFQYLCAPNDSVFLLNWYGRLANGNIIAGNASGGGMLSLFSEEGSFLRFYEEVPDKKALDERLSDWANGTLYIPIGSVSPDGDKVALVYDYADIVTMVQTGKGDSLRTASVRKALPNDVLAVQFGEHVVAGSITPKTVIHYQSVTTSEKYIYALYLGRPYEEIEKTGYNSTVVKVYDWEGELCKELHLDRTVRDIKVTPDDKLLYAIEESENGYSVLRYRI